MAELEYRGFQSERKFGIELEVAPSIPQEEVAATITILNPHSKVTVSSSWRQTEYNNLDWHVKRDSTCGPLAHLGQKSYGWEIVPSVSRWPDFPNIARTIDVLRLKGVETNSNCGLHVHADASDLEITDAAMFMAWWCKSEFVVSNMLPVGRTLNKYCQLYHHCYALSGYTSLGDFWNEIKPRDYSTHGNTDRRYAINLVNFCAWHDKGISSSRNLPTLELRLPEGTMNSDDVKGWILLFLCMVDRYPKLHRPSTFSGMTLEDFLWALGLIGDANRLHFPPPLLSDLEYSFYILDSDLFFLKKWIFSRLSIFSRNERLRQQASILYNHITEMPSRRRF